jgi:transmembrane sensor
MKDNIDENLYIANLIFRHLIGRLSPEEEKTLAAWAQLSQGNRRLLNSFEDDATFFDQWVKFNTIDREVGWKQLQDRDPELRMMTYAGTYLGSTTIQADKNHHYSPLLRSRLIKGASLFVFLLIIFFTWYYRHRFRGDHLELALGYQKTYVEEECGPTISLDARTPGSVIQEGALDITLVEQRLLSLHAENPRPGITDSHLTLYTANGGKCSIALPDGSRVHLNAASYIQFPAHYSQQEREVNLGGEAYLEIKPPHATAADRPIMPFIVHVMRPPSMRTNHPDSNLLTITATGTVFNIKAYDSSSVQTTLVSGTMDVQRTGDTAVSHLTKGDSYVLSRDGSYRIQPSNLQSATGWKDGEFIFEKQPLDEILQELARSYDVKVEYQDTPSGTFSLRGTRAEKLKDILDRIAGNKNTHFTVGDSGIIVAVSH